MKDAKRVLGKHWSVLMKRHKEMPTLMDADVDRGRVNRGKHSGCELKIVTMITKRATEVMTQKT